MPSRTVIGPESKQPVRSQSLIDFGHLKLPQLALALDLDLGLWLLLAVGGCWQLAGRFWLLVRFCVLCVRLGMVGVGGAD